MTVYVLKSWEHDHWMNVKVTADEWEANHWIEPWAEEVDYNHDYDVFVVEGMH